MWGEGRADGCRRPERIPASAREGAQPEWAELYAQGKAGLTTAESVEREFLRETSRRLAIRAAEVEAVGAANVGLLTMKDFPPLPDTEAGPE